MNKDTCGSGFAALSEVALVSSYKKNNSRRKKRRATVLRSCFGPLQKILLTFSSERIGRNEHGISLCDILNGKPRIIVPDPDR
jgi:hypothetical protein